MIFVQAISLLMLSIASMTSAGTYEDVRKYILQNYDTVAYPPLLESKATNVTFNLMLLQIDINEDRQTLVTNAWVSLEWKDKRLSWDNIANLKNVTKVSFMEHEIWTPDMLVYDDASQSPIPIKRDVNIVVKSDGTAIWIQPRILESLCALDFLSWPLDSHTCVFKMGHWTESVETVDLNPSDQVDTSIMTGGSGWSIENSEMERQELHYDCCPEAYVSVGFTFTLQRSSCLYASFMIAPVVVISLILFFQFLIPRHHAGRIIVCCCCALLTFLQLFYISNQLPMTHSNIPYIVGYYLILLIVNILGFLVNFVSLHISSRGEYKKV